MPGAPPSQRDHSSSSEQLQTLQALSECCSLVLRLATDPEKQAELLVDCVCRAVTGRVEQAVPVLQLLPMLLRHVVANRAAVSEQLHQVRRSRWACWAQVMQPGTLHSPCLPCYSWPP